VIVCGNAGTGKRTLLAALIPTDRYGLLVEVAPTDSDKRYLQCVASAAPAATLALVVIDATQGLTPATRRDCALASLFGIPQVVLAVTKMDLAGYSEESFRAIGASARQLAARLRLGNLECVPVSGLRSENVLTRSERMPWHHGPTLMQGLENCDAQARSQARSSPFRLWVQRPLPSEDAGTRALTGTVAGGRVAPGDRVVVLPSGRESVVERVGSPDADQDVTLTLAEAVEIKRGDLISAAIPHASVGDQFEATVVWMADAPLISGRCAVLSLGTQTATATATQVKHKLDRESLEQVAATRLEPGQIGICDLALGRRIAFDPYRANRGTGAFLLLDPDTLDPVGAGLLRCALRQSQDVCWQAVDVEKAGRAALKRQRPCIVWLTGLPSAGKSTIANLVERRLHSSGYHTYLLDGDNVRHGLNKDLGFTPAERAENVRRVGEVAKLMVEAGLIVICSFISPAASGRDAVRALVDDGEFIEVHVDASLEVVEDRDPKGLYRKARRGELADFTGIDAPYEPPENPEVHLDADVLAPEASAERVIGALVAAGAVERSLAG
jgi:bifunctional enzyme CysN/CysC